MAQVVRGREFGRDEQFVRHSLILGGIGEAHKAFVAGARRNIMPFRPHVLDAGPAGRY
jgi:hypothetical protein